VIARSARLILIALCCFAATGCRHRVKAVLPQPATAPVPIENPPEPDHPPLIAQVPLTPTPTPAIKVPAAKIKKPRKKATPSMPPPVEIASATPPPSPGAAIGALTAGGDARPERRQQAATMITDLDKRLGNLSATIQDSQKEGIARVRYFSKQSREALDAGDIEGAVILVTKAKVLLDDLTK
jgi:hypothetical protein